MGKASRIPYGTRGNPLFMTPRRSHACRAVRRAPSWELLPTIYLYKVYSLRGTSPAHVAREGPYAAVTFCCQGMRRESGHWAGEGLGSGGWERGSLLATECHGCVRAFNGHRPHPASRKAGESQIAQWAYGALSRLALPGVFCISRRRWTGTPCQIRQD